MRKKDEFGVLNSKGKREVTLKKICDIIGVQVPEAFLEFQNNIIDNVAAKLENATEGCGYFRIVKINSENDTIKAWLPKILKKKVSVIFVEKEQYLREGLDKEEYPIIPVDDVLEKCGKFFSYIKDLNDVKTLAVTGTCGKTTTMKFLNHIVPNTYKTYTNEGNANSYGAVAKHIFSELTPDKEVYIQEVGAAAIDSVKKSAAMLTVDAFVLLNIFNHHINEYKTQQNILKDKASLDDYMHDGGVVVANYDDDMIANHTFKHKVITFGIDTEREVDYRAINVIQDNEVLRMDIIHNNQKSHVDVNILGVQNAYNVLATFALSSWLGISEKKIIDGFSSYESIGFRQNFTNIGGYNLILDCYNICEDSLKADLDTVKKIKIEPGRKRIAVITGENKLGPNAEEISYNLGKSLDLTGIDNIICRGIKEETPENIDYYCHGRALYEGIRASGYQNIVYVTNAADMEAEISKVASLGDLILFKGMYNLDLTPVVDRLFGTSLAMNNPYYTKRSKLFKEHGFVGRKVKIIDGVDLIKNEIKKCKQLKIPSSLQGKPVFRISEGLFKLRKDIKSVDLGSSLVNIGRNAFAGCIRLKRITIPSNVKVIEFGAFQFCLGLKEVVIEEGVTHIGRYAFRGCVGLRKVHIPESVKYIDKEAFNGCPLVDYRK